MFPYLNGEDMNSDPLQKPLRWVINFFDWPRERARLYEDVFSIVEVKVRPEREKINTTNSTGKRRHDFWWQYGGDAKGLYHAIGRGSSFEKHPNGWEDIQVQEKVLVTARTQNFLKWATLPSKKVFADCLVILTIPISNFALLSSSIFQEWTRKTSTTLKFDINFTPSPTYETFPFPSSHSPLSRLGEKFDSHRRKIMLTRQIGLTALYNLFHNPGETAAELEEMRCLQCEIDTAVRDSYGRQDIDLDHGFHEVGYLPVNDNARYTISEPARIEILKRLAKLNKERWEEEKTAGLHKKKGGE